MAWPGYRVPMGNREGRKFESCRPDRKASQQCDAFLFGKYFWNGMARLSRPDG